MKDNGDLDAYQGFEPTGRQIEMFGVSIAKVSDDLRLLEVEHHYDPNSFAASPLPPADPSAIGDGRYALAYGE